MRGGQLKLAFGRNGHQPTGGRKNKADTAIEGEEKFKTITSAGQQIRHVGELSRLISHHGAPWGSYAPNKPYFITNLNAISLIQSGSKFAKKQEQCITLVDPYGG